MKFEPVDPAPTETGCPLVLFRRVSGGSSLELGNAPTREHGDRGRVSNAGGGRDLYYQRIRGNRAEGAPQRLTTGLKIHGISVGGGDRGLVSADRVYEVR